MLVSWNWLADYVPLDMPVEDLTTRLTLAGLNLESVETVEDDTAIDLEVTSNRPDCLGHLGIAREVGVLYGRDIAAPPARIETVREPTADATSVAIECPDLCPTYLARIVRGVRIGPSPEWMQRRLRAVGITPINNVVDVTNYVLMECGQPLHAFDFDRLAGKRIFVRRPRPGESIKAIDHKEYNLSPEMCLICDAQRPVAIGGVMGGADTEINAATKNVLVEVANFQPLSIHHTARALRLHSPSSYRFERKINDQQMDWASRRCCELIVATAGGEVLDGAVLAGEIPDWRPEPVRFRFAQVPRILGIEVPRARSTEILTRLGLEPVGTATDDEATFLPPAWRRDLTREIDLIEEVARIHGYDQIPEDRTIPMVAGTRSLPERIDDRVRSVLAAAGFCEAITFSFTPAAARDIFVPHPDAPQLTIRPAAGEYGDLLRQSLIPSLVLCRRDNARRGNTNAELFEIARTYLRTDPGDPRGQPRRVGIVSGRSFAELRGVAEALADAVNHAARVTTRPSAVSQFLPGRGSELLLDGEFWGWLGELDRDAPGLKDLKLRDALTVAELDLQRLADVADLVPAARPLAEFPAIQRDLNFVLEEAVTWDRLSQTVRTAAGPNLEEVRFLEQYRGQHIPAGKKSYVLALSFRAGDRTLTAEEVDAAQQSVIAACSRDLAAILR